MEQIERCIRALHSRGASAERRGPLLGSQESLWFLFYASVNVGGSLIESAWSVPPGKSPEEVQDALSDLVRRHESLRTTYSLSGNNWHPEQVVHPPYRMEYSIVTEHGDVEAVGAAIRSEPMDLASQWPVRAGLLVRDNRVVMCVMVFNHVAIDYESIRVLTTEFEALIAGHSLPAPGAPQPLAAAERSGLDSPRRRRASAAWNERLARIPATMTPMPRAPDRVAGAGPFMAATIRVEGISAAAEKIAVRCKAHASAVFLTAYTAVLCHRGRLTRCAVLSDTRNRLERDLAEAVGCFAQKTLVVADLSPRRPMRDIAQSMSNELLRGARNGQYSYFEAQESVARVAWDRGRQLRLATHFNYIPGPAAPTRYVGPLSEHAELRWELDCPWEEWDTDVYLCIGSGDSDALFLLARSSVFDPATIESTLRSIVRLIDCWADDSQIDERELESLCLLAGVSQLAYDSRWCHLDGSWVDLAEVDALLEQLPGIAAAGTFVDGGELIAYLFVEDDALGPSAVRRLLLDAIGALDATNAAVPHRFVRCTSTPADRTQEGWAGQPFEWDDNGRELPLVRPSTDRQRTICEVIATYSGIDVPSVELSYVRAGGRVACAPAVLGGLAEAGWVGITLSDLLGVQSIAALASRLRPGR